MAYTREVAATRDDLDDSVALAISINRFAEECWKDYRDVRLEGIAADAKEIQKAIKRVSTRLFGQGQLFGTGEEEPVASRRAEFSPQGRERTDV